MQEQAASENELYERSSKSEPPTRTNRQQQRAGSKSEDQAIASLLQKRVASKSELEEMASCKKMKAV
jgi:hypothetical protein